MPGITLQQANTIASAAFAKGGELGLKPLTVAVLDAGAMSSVFSAKTALQLFARRSRPQRPAAHSRLAFHPARSD